VGLGSAVHSTRHRHPLALPYGAAGATSQGPSETILEGLEEDLEGEGEGEGAPLAPAGEEEEEDPTAPAGDGGPAHMEVQDLDGAEGAPAEGSSADGAPDGDSEAAVHARVEAFSGKLVPEELSKLSAVGAAAAQAAAKAGAEAGASAGEGPPFLGPFPPAACSPALFTMLLLCCSNCCSYWLAVLDGLPHPNPLSSVCVNVGLSPVHLFCVGCAQAPRRVQRRGSGLPGARSPQGAPCPPPHPWSAKRRRQGPVPALRCVHHPHTAPLPPRAYKYTYTKGNPRACTHARYIAHPSAFGTTSS
jgi:hypothetical protein